MSEWTSRGLLRLYMNDFRGRWSPRSDEGLIAKALELGAELTDGEAGAGLVNTLQFTVAHDLGIGIVLLQRTEQRVEGELLGGSPGVGRTALLVEASLVADADGVGVVVAGVCADHLFGAAEVELAVAGDVVVVAAALPAFGFVHLVEQLHGNVLVRARCCTMNHN